ncbi:LysR family transcriptional regulator ArgP [Vibrio salinus]|uniref:LysR family transcriptional regulator ArgP n=1 Tax=Vibrio salinus TaxID=2899784 RepID=UPI001E4AFCBE|nr:LysR family transcriptional regulator ArgP [Vibrio salinus]MCE0494971.1 LysR family transcriptional regulator ArgP [Vibrio salinus]
MSLLSPQVAAFIAVIEEESFEGAAKRLSVTPSAISQRIKTLEDRIGQLLVIRQSPCQPTPAGERLLSRVKPMSLLEAEVLADFIPEQDNLPRSHPLPIAVNEDSLSTWLITALAELNQHYGNRFDIRIDDQEYTLDHLKNGSVIGAITSEKTPLQGCTVHTLGKMRYCAIASPRFAEHYFKQGLTAAAFQQAPVLIYNRKDPLQMRFMKAITNKSITPANIQYLPSSGGLVDAAAQHMGWTMAAEGLLDNAVREGKVVNLAPDTWLEEPLYWQHAAVRSKILSQITQVFYSASYSELQHSDG